MKKVILSLLFGFGVGTMQAQSIPPGVIPAATEAANEAIPGLGAPISWRWELILNINDSSLGCPLVEGTPLAAPISVYRTVLEYADTTYVVYVSADSTRTQLCDEQFPEPEDESVDETAVTPAPSSGACVAQLVDEFADTYPEPAGTNVNYTLFTSQTYTVLESALDGTWYRVAVAIDSLDEFWLPANTVTLSGDGCETLPVDTEDSVVNVCILSPIGTFANVRAAPDVDAPQVDAIFENTTHGVIGRNEDFSWYRIQSGWVSASVATLRGDCRAVEFLVNDVQVDSEDGEFSGSPFVCSPDSDLYMTPRLQVGAATAQVDEGGIPNTIRASPSTAAEQLGTAQPGRRFDRVIEGPACNEGYTWWQVEIDGVIGWTAESNGATDEYYLVPVSGTEAETPQMEGDATDLTGFDSAVTSMTFSPNGVFLVTANGADLMLQVWDVEARVRITPAPEHTAPINRVAFSSEGLVAAAGMDNTVYIWGAESDEPLITLPDVVSVRFVSDMTFSPDGTLLATAGCAQAGQLSDCVLGEVRLWDVATGEEVANLRGHNNVAYRIAFNNDGSLLASSSVDGVWVWDTASGAQERVLSSDNLVEDVAFQPDEPTIMAAAGCAESVVQDNVLTCNLGEVRLWDVETGAVQDVLRHPDNVLSVAYSPDGTALATGSNDGVVRLWNVSVETAVLIETFEGHGDAIDALVFSPDGMLFASASRDLTVRLWEFDLDALMQSVG